MAETTTDRVVLSELTVEPGGEYGFFTVNLEGSKAYTGYEVHLILPEGLEVFYSDDAPVVYMANDDLSLDGNDIYPYTTNIMTKKKTYGSSCHIKGSRQVVEQLQKLITDNKLDDKVDLGGTFCLGNCQKGVCVMVDENFHSVSPETVDSFFADEVLAKV